MPQVTFANDIRPLFREKDRSSMLDRFDLWSFQDVKDNAQRILAVLRAGRMPCDGAWSDERINLFAQWIDGGMSE
jgi:hypothetical protein